MKLQQKITPFLAYNHQAEAAARWRTPNTLSAREPLRRTGRERTELSAPGTGRAGHRPRRDRSHSVESRLAHEYLELS